MYRPGHDKYGSQWFLDCSAGFFRELQVQMRQEATARQTGVDKAASGGEQER